MLIIMKVVVTNVTFVTSNNTKWMISTMPQPKKSDYYFLEKLFTFNN
jgi:hypothetical protein